MKDDLISKEELIKKITEQYDMQYGNYPLSNVIDCIQNQPSANKQDEIIEQLKKCRDTMLSPVTQDCFGEECRYNDCMACVFAKAIEIVKRGGL